MGEELAQWQQSGAYSDQDVQDLLEASGLLARTTYQKLMSSHPIRFVWWTAATLSPRKSAAYKSATAYS